MKRGPFDSLEDYRRTHRGFKLTVPESFNFGYDVVDQWAADRPASTALWWVGPGGQERTLTFRDIASRSNKLANALRDLGLQRGDQVMVNLASVPEWWECMVALAKADLVAIPTTTMLTPKDIAFRLEAAEVDAVITDDRGAEKLEAVAPPPSEPAVRVQVGKAPHTGWESYEALVIAASDRSPGLETRGDGHALIYFTSGTTGPPKMVLHSHGSSGVGHRLTAEFWLNLEPGDVHWNMSDPGWAKTAFAGYFGPWIQGACVFVSHRPGKFDAPHTLRTMVQYPIQSMCAPPTVYRMLVQEDLSDFAPRSLGACRGAGEALNPEVLGRWREATGITIREGYGQSETVLLCASLPDLPVRPGSMGLPVPGIDLAVIDAAGNRLPPGVTGEIAVRVEPERPPGLFSEYWQAPEATAKCFHRGWYLTGDCAQTDEDGYLWFVSRADDIITSSAYRIGPFEVESALMEHPSVAEVAVVGKPDPERTEIVKAFVVLARGHEPTEKLAHELQAHARASTAPYKYPREVEFVDELPKTVSGKIRRAELRARDA